MVRTVRIDINNTKTCNFFKNNGKGRTQESRLNGDKHHARGAVLELGTLNLRGKRKKGRGEDGGRKGKGKGAPALRAYVFA